MKRTLTGMAAVVLCFCCAIGTAQDIQELLQRSLGEIRQSIIQNQTQLRAYEWTETTELSLSGEVKNRSQKECRYDPDGKLQKIPIGSPTESPKATRGMGKLVEKKTEELKNYMDRFGSLISRYIPPDPAQMQASFQSGKASIGMSSGGTQGSLVFENYAKPGDKVTLAFDPAAKRLSNYKVATYLDGPEDAVTVDARFATLDDGTNYVEDVILTSRSKQLKIEITNFGHKKAQ